MSELCSLAALPSAPVDGVQLQRTHVFSAPVWVVHLYNRFLASNWHSVVGSPSRDPGDPGSVSPADHTSGTLGVSSTDSPAKPYCSLPGYDSFRRLGTLTTSTML